MDRIQDVILLIYSNDYQPGGPNLCVGHELIYGGHQMVVGKNNKIMKIK